MVNSPYINPFEELGSTGQDLSLENLGLEFSYYTDLMSGALKDDGSFGFEYAGEDFGVEEYNLSQENLLRESFKENFLDFKRSLGDIYSSSLGNISSSITERGKRGIASGGFNQTQELQKSIAEEIKGLRESITEQRMNTIESIYDVRQSYSDELFSLYNTYLDAFPEASENQDTILDCYQQNKVFDPNTGECAELLTDFAISSPYGT